MKKNLILNYFRYKVNTYQDIFTGLKIPDVVMVSGVIRCYTIDFTIFTLRSLLNSKHW